MASPQPDRHTRISNELLEALLFSKLPARELRIMLAVMRLTYGFQRKSHRIALSTLSEMTDISRGNCGDIVSRLIEDKYLCALADRYGRRELAIQKDYRLWKECDLPEGITATGVDFGTIEGDDCTDPAVHSDPPERYEHDDNVYRQGSGTSSGTAVQSVPPQQDAIQKESFKENFESKAAASNSEKKTSYGDGLSDRNRALVFAAAKDVPKYQANPNIATYTARRLQDRYGEDVLHRCLLAALGKAKKNALALAETMLSDGETSWESNSHSSVAPRKSLDPLTAWIEEDPLWDAVKGAGSDLVRERTMRHYLKRDYPEISLDVAGMSARDFVLAIRKATNSIPSHLAS